MDTGNETITVAWSVVVCINRMCEGPLLSISFFKVAPGKEDGFNQRMKADPSDMLIRDLT